MLCYTTNGKAYLLCFRRIVGRNDETLPSNMYRRFGTPTSGSQIQKICQAFGNLMPGKIAPDFELIDREGKKCRLSDLKGKYLFVDFWATWCHGCVLEIPYMVKCRNILPMMTESL